MLYNSSEAGGNRAHVTHRKRERESTSLKYRKTTTQQHLARQNFFSCVLRLPVACVFSFCFSYTVPLFLCCKRSCTTGGFSFSNCSAAPVSNVLARVSRERIKFLPCHFSVKYSERARAKHCVASHFRFGRTKTN